jgi:hypothetical protein
VCVCADLCADLYLCLRECVNDSWRMRECVECDADLLRATFVYTGFPSFSVLLLDAVLTNAMLCYSLSLSLSSLLLFSVALWCA